MEYTILGSWTIKWSCMHTSNASEFCNSVQALSSKSCYYSYRGTETCCFRIHTNFNQGYYRYCL